VTLAVFAIVILLGASVAFLGPMISGALSPMLVGALTQGKLDGQVLVSDVHLSWRGPQKIGAVELRNAQGVVVASGAIEAGTNLLSALLGSRDLGDITLRGRFDLPGALATLRQATEETRSAGGPAVADAPNTSTAPSSPSGLAATSLSPSLKANIKLDDVTVVFASDADQTDDSAVGLKDITGTVDFAVGAPISVKLDANALGGAGSVDLALALDNVTNATGALTSSAASVDATLNGTIAPNLLARLAETLGSPNADTLTNELTQGPVAFTASYNGGAKAGQGSFTIKGQIAGRARLLAHASVDYADGRVKLSQPATFSAPISQPLIDRLVGADQAGGIAIDQPIGVTVNISSLDLPMPTGGALDLRGASLNLSIETTQATGRVALAERDSDAADRGVFRISQVICNIEAHDLAGPVTARATTHAMFQGADAGAFTLDLHSGELLDENGSYRGGLPALGGDVTIVGASMGLLQPFVDRFGIDLSHTLGASVDAELHAQPRATSKQSDHQKPTTDVAFSLDATRLSAHGRVAIDADQITTHGGLLLAEFQSAEDVLDAVVRAVAPTSEAQFTGAGTLLLSVSGTVPLTGGAIRLDEMQVSAGLGAKGFSVKPKADGPTIDVKSFTSGFTLEPGQPSRASLTAALADGKHTFEIQSRASASELFDSSGSIDAAHPHLSASVRLSDAPTKMIASIAGFSNEDAELLVQSIGEKIIFNVSGDFSPVDVPTVFNVYFSGNSQSIGKPSGQTIGLATLLLTEGVELRVADATVGIVNPESINRILQRVVPDMADRVQFASPVRLSLGFKSFAIPLQASGMPDLSAMAPVQATFQSSDNVLFTRVPVGEGPTIDAGLRRVHGKVMFDPLRKRHGDITIRGSLFNPRSSKDTVADLLADASLTSNGFDATARALRLDTPRLDALLGKPDLFALSLGSPAEISLKTSRKSAADPMTVRVRVKSPRLTATALVHADSDRVALTAPIEARWTMDERWASRYVTPTPDGIAPALRVVGPTPMTLSIKRAAFGLNGKPMKPGVFDLDAHVNAPSLTLQTSGDVATRRRDISLDVSSASAPGVIEYHASMISDDPAQAPFRMVGQVSQLADDSGALTPQRAAITFQADGDLPTPLIDALAHAGGIVVEAIGPTITLRATSDRFSYDGGSLDASASSSLASAAIAGHAGAGAFSADGPSRITLTTISPKLGELVFHKIFPMIGTLEKKPSDHPATIVAHGLVLPIDNDMSKLSGSLDVNLGRISYSASPFFAIMLAATNTNPDALLLADWPPLKVTIDHGVARYDRVSLPVGAIALDTQGEVDLVHQRASIIVYAPFFTLMDQVANVARRVPGVSSDTLIPIRIKGPLGSLQAEPAIDLLPNELFKHPENIIKGILKKGGFFPH